MKTNGDEVRIGDGHFPVKRNVQPTPTFRQECAKAAMQGILANPYRDLQVGPHSGNQNERVAKISVSLADALIKELRESSDHE